MDFEPAFVGRDSYLKNLDTVWKGHAVFGVFGIKSVGKSRLVNEFLNRKKVEMLELFKVFTLDLKHFETTVDSMVELFSSAFDTNIEIDENWKERVIKDIGRKMKGERFVIVFDNAEKFLENDTKIHDEFLALCVMLVRNCRGLKIIVTSTTKFLLSQIRNAFYKMEVSMMTKSETLQLLRQESDDLELGKSAKVLAELCNGMPMAVMVVVSKLKEDNGLLRPEELVELLLRDHMKCFDCELYPLEDRAGVHPKLHLEKNQPLFDLYERLNEGQSPRGTVSRISETVNDVYGASGYEKECATASPVIPLGKNIDIPKYRFSEQDGKRGASKKSENGWTDHAERKSYRFSFCEQCGKHSLIDNTFVTAGENERLCASKGELFCNLSSNKASEIYNIDLKMSHLWLGENRHAATTEEDETNVYVTTHKVNGDKKNNDQQLNGLILMAPKPAKMSESACACIQCEELS